MKTKIKKILILVVAIIISSGIFTGCKQNKNLVVSYDEAGSFAFEKTGDTIFPSFMTVIEMVSTLDELKDVCVKWNNPSFQEESKYFTNEQSVKIQSYDEKFFNDKILIIYSFNRGQRKETVIEGVSVDGNKLIVNAKLISRKGRTFTDDLFSWLILIEVSKSEVVGATTVEVRFK